MREFLDRYSIRQIVTVAIATPVLALFAAVFAIAAGWLDEDEKWVKS